MPIQIENIIANTYIQFQGLSYDKPVEEEPAAPESTEEPPQEPVPSLEEVLKLEMDMDFGILKMKLNDTEMTKTPQLLYFKVDMSGSMEDKCSDGRTKMQHSNHTIKNILTIAAENEEAEIWVQIDAFDGVIQDIVQTQLVTKENLSTLIHSVDAIRPRNGTNIELALNDSREKINRFKQSHPEFKVSHIFTTDGQANEGCIDNKKLSELIDSSYTNIFIGYGVDHSAATLIALSSVPNSEYYFIDKIENGGLVFGEVMHSILYKALTDVVIEVTNAEIYNFKTNEWQQTLNLDYLTGDAEKTFHLKAKNPYDVEINISGKEMGQKESKLLTTEYCMPRLINKDDTEVVPLLDLSKYIFRQKVQELLYEVKSCVFNTYPLKKKLSKLHSQMKAYVKKHELTEDPLFKTLNDDIVVALKTLGTQFQYMYATARSTSNGRERSYNVNEIPDESDYPSAPFRFNAVPLKRRNAFPLQRANAVVFDEENQIYLPNDNDLEYDDDEEEEDQLLMLNRAPLAYQNSSTRALSMMRSCSIGTQAEDILNEEPSI